jgi:hypothetical protein
MKKIALALPLVLTTSGVVVGLPPLTPMPAAANSVGRGLKTHPHRNAGRATQVQNEGYLGSSHSFGNITLSQWLSR